MTLAEKVGEINLLPDLNVQNANEGVSRLCIPPLTLQDGPNGITDGHRGVTQLPASIGVAATFNTALAYDYGQVLGAEARTQGIDVVQAPNLNIARLPNSGRIFEGYGEDPTLVSAMGVAEIQGIQSQGVMAEAKHFGLYTQETNRFSMNQTVSLRVLEEVYLPAFKAAIQQGDVAALMCAVGEINGVNTCSDSLLYAVLGSWGFTGFVRSDMGVVSSDPVAAFNDGLDLIKPSEYNTILAAAEDGQLSIGRLNSAVLAVLTAMFKYGLIEHPLTGNRNTHADTAAHANTALAVAEQSIVLLKNKGNILPLDKTDLHSVAIIGRDANSSAGVAGYGSAYAIPPFVITPLDAIRQWFGHGTHVSFTAGEPSAATVVTPMTQNFMSIPQEPSGTPTPAMLTAASPGNPGTPGWQETIQIINPPKTGVYEFSVQSKGDVWIYLNNQLLIAKPGQTLSVEGWTATAQLVAGQSYTLRVNWCSWVPEEGGQPVIPVIGWDYVTPEIRQAVTAAHNAQVAIVFANDYSREGTDRPTLSLPSDEDALIEAVAAANPRTIVVLNTDGAVLMPWLSQVAAVLEAWYPGEEDGAAITAVLSGAFDPSGHLPVTFPRSDAASPMGSAESWPGVDETVDLDTLDIGYRWYDVNGDDPLFPFGFGLSYTTFSLSGAIVTKDGSGYQVTTTVKNDGSRTGTAVVQAYLTYPAAAQEPPYELKAFASVTLIPGESQAINIDLPASAFQIYSGTEFSIVGGTYTVSLGQNERNLPVRAKIAVRSETIVTPPSSDEAIPTEQGTILNIPVTTVKAIYNTAGVSSTVQASGILIVSHTVHPVSFTCMVTLISPSGTRSQKLISAIEGVDGTWTVSKA
jgi:beta-glucosidase